MLSNKLFWMFYDVLCGSECHPALYFQTDVVVVRLPMFVPLDPARFCLRVLPTMGDRWLPTMRRKPLEHPIRLSGLQVHVYTLRRGTFHTYDLSKLAQQFPTG